MYVILDYVLLIIKNIVHVLSIKPFPDVNLSYIELLCGSVVIGALLKLCFGGLKESERFTNSTLKDFTKTSKNISNDGRKKQVVEEYEPRHAKK